MANLVTILFGRLRSCVFARAKQALIYLPTRRARRKPDVVYLDIYAFSGRHIFHRRALIAGSRL